ncbi:MAG: 50S ribosomal protein L22 [Spirochaetales bacterium]|nr:50S ribosomal protein L22 [Spirochaetales bacterium]MCF7937790.1 50S ribosomal protein L22 [Spirochaetales bacterium]
MNAKKGYHATAKYLLASPFKVRPIADEVRRKAYPEAIAILENLPNKGAKLLKKVIESAAANALFQNKQLDEDMLFVSELLVDEGPRMKRMWARGRGRRDILLKRMCHISAAVDEISSTGE